MPELPEVETIRAGLESFAVGRTVLQAEGRDSRLFRHNPESFASVNSTVQGQKIIGAHRRGKFLWLVFEGEPRSLLIHLGMSGQVRVTTKGSAPAELQKHEHLRLNLGRVSVRFIDPRTFGHLTISELEMSGERKVPKFLRHIAPDPLEPGFDLDRMLQRARQSTRPVKTMLLDQTLLSGIGNIYADEGLFRARILGTHQGRDLTVAEWEKLVWACANVMEEAVAVGGTSFDTLYVDVQGNSGYFTRTLAVYGRAGKLCRRDGHTIERAVIAGRSHFFCAACQR